MTKAIDPDVEQDNVTNLKKALLSTSQAAIFYGALHQAINHSRLPKRALEASQATFLLNCLLSGSCGLRTLVSADFKRDMVNAYPSWLHSGFSFFAGYLVYDSCRLYSSGHGTPELWVHHLLGLAGTWATMTVRKLSYCPASTLFTEFSLISVYWLQRVKSHKVESPNYDRTLKMAHILRLVATLFFRTFLIPLASIRCFRLLKKQLSIPSESPQTNCSRDVWTELQSKAQVPSWVVLCTLCNITVFSALNLIWTRDIAKSTLATLRQSA